jgi:hypothetical protein
MFEAVQSLVIGVLGGLIASILLPAGILAVFYVRAAISEWRLGRGK